MIYWGQFQVIIDINLVSRGILVKISPDRSTGLNVLHIMIHI
jgi:hypothetical protein